MKTQYRCTDCGLTFELEPTLMVCPQCSKNQKPDEPLLGILEVEYEGKIDKNFNVFDFLPVEKEFFPPIPVGNTPLWEPKNLREKLGFKNLYFKDDSSNPTSSFKDRASYLVSAFAKKHGINEIVLASTGNAGSSMAGVGAAQGQDITIFLPKAAPPAKMIQAQQYGAKVILVDGNYDRAFDFSLEYSKVKGGMNRNTAYNPMTIEGKKTVSLEVVKDLGEAPDYVFVSTGDGCILAGVYKGYKDLFTKGIIEKVPTVYSVQSTGSDALYRAFNSADGKFENIPTATVADSICVDVPRNGYHALKQLKEFGGKVITVSDEDIIKSQKDLSSSTGLFTEPAGATAYAGFLKAMNDLPRDAKIVVMTTGNGLKDTATAAKGVEALPTPINSISEIK